MQINRAFKYIFAIFILANLYIFTYVYIDKYTPKIEHKLVDNSSSSKAQESVKKLIDSVVVPWWESPKKIKQASVELQKELYDFLHKKPQKVYKFSYEKVQKIKGGYSVNVISNTNPYRVLNFKLDNTTKVVGLEFKDKEFKKEQISKLLQELEQAKDDYSIFTTLLKLKVLVSNTYITYYDSDKTKEYILKEIERLKSKKAKEKIDNFTNRYPLIASYLNSYGTYEAKNYKQGVYRLYRFLEDRESIDFEKYRGLLSKIYTLNPKLKPSRRFVKRFKFKKDYKMACKMGDARACNSIGYKLFRNKKYLEAIEYYKKACDLNFGISCLSLGNIYYKEKYKMRDMNKSVNYYKKACDLNVSTACQIAGLAYLYNIHIKKDTNTALKYLKKGCNLKNSSSCYSLGLTYEKKKFFDKGKIYYYLDKACTLKYSHSCYYLGTIYQKGKYGDKDINKAKKYYKIACDLKNNISCLHLGELYLKLDKKEAKKIFEKIVNSKSITAKGASYRHLASLDTKNREFYLIQSCKNRFAKACCKIPREQLFKLEYYKKSKKYIDRVCKIRKKHAK